jgi:hypothetical protein
MAGMTGTMGLGLAAFVAVWTLMMTAMMLPSVTPTATLYAKTMQRNRAMRIAGLVAGYLAVWAAAGLPAYGLARLAGWLTGMHPSAAHIMAVAVFAVAGIYQLTSLKDRCLAHCRSPLGLLLHYGSYRGRLRTDGDPGRGGPDERRSHGWPGRRSPHREGLAPRPCDRPARGCRCAGSRGGHHLASLARSGAARRTPNDDELIPKASWVSLPR